MTDDHFRIEKIVQPLHWCGMTKPGAPNAMVCGACPMAAECAANDRCSRASDEDYAHVKKYRGIGLGE